MNVKKGAADRRLVPLFSQEATALIGSLGGHFLLFKSSRIAATTLTNVISTIVNERSSSKVT